MKKSLKLKVKLMNRVENISTNGEIAHHEQFHPLPKCFQRSSAAEASESVYMMERVNIIANNTSHEPST